MTDVDVGHVYAAASIGWDVHFARTKREPCHPQTSADTEVIAKPWPAPDKDNQCGRIDGADMYRPRHPHPDAVDHNPAAIVERCKSPRRIVDPRPAPWLDPHPVSKPVRSPSRSDHPRSPDMSVN